MAGNVWNQILALIETKVNRHSFYTWFKPTSFLDDRGQTIIVKVPNDLFRDWLTKHYAGVIGEAVDELERHGTVISFVTAPVSPAPSTPIQPPASDPVTHRPRTAAPLNQRYTFSKFVVGPSNQFAHAAACAVAEAPSRSYNPLFIYGGVGLGKTHLMHAIGQYLDTHMSARSGLAEEGRMRAQVVQPQELAGESVRTPARGIPCEGCGTLFTARRPSQRFCHSACRPLAQRRRETDRRAKLLARLLPDDPGRSE